MKSYVTSGNLKLFEFCAKNMLTDTFDALGGMKVLNALSQMEHLPGRILCVKDET